MKATLVVDKLKLFTVIAGILLITTKAYAFENVISLGAGVGFAEEKLSQSIGKTATYNYTDEQGKQQTTTLNQTINRTWKLDGNSPKFNAEYQARFQYVSLGLGLETYNPELEYTFTNDAVHGNTSVKLQEHNIQPYLILLVNAVKTKYFNLAVGTQFGVNFYSIDSNYKDYLTNGKNTRQISFVPQLVIDGEFNVTGHFSIFSRFSVNPINLLREYNYKSNLATSDDKSIIPFQVPGSTLASNSISNKVENGDGTTLALNFGIRYKF